MRHSKGQWVHLVLFVWVVGMSGCMGLPMNAPRLLRRNPERKHPKVPDLRIPGDALARGPDIPVVPIAPPPLYPGKGRPDVPTEPLPNTPQTVPTKPKVEAQPQPPLPTLQPTPKPTPVPVQQPDVANVPPVGLPPLQPVHAPTTNPLHPTPDPTSQLPRNTNELLTRALNSYAHMESYIVRLTRREEVKGKKQPEEVMMFKFRKHPWSLHLKWLSKEGAGREVIYVKGMYGNKLHTLLARGDIPLVPAGKQMSFAIDSALVRSASRYPITDAGFGACLQRCERAREGIARGERRWGTMKFQGLQRRPDFSQPLLMLEHHLPPGLEEPLPRGGRRLIGFSTKRYMPVLVQTFDDRANEVEYYRYDRLQTPVGLDDADFDPDRLWGGKSNNHRK